MILVLLGAFLVVVVSLTFRALLLQPVMLVRVVVLLGLRLVDQWLALVRVVVLLVLFLVDRWLALVLPFLMGRLGLPLLLPSTVIQWVPPLLLLILGGQSPSLGNSHTILLLGRPHSTMLGFPSSPTPS